MSNPNFCAARTFFLSFGFDHLTEKECVQSRRVLMRRTMSATFCSSLACSSSNSFSAFFFFWWSRTCCFEAQEAQRAQRDVVSNRIKIIVNRRRCSLSLNFGRRRFRGREERGRFGGGLRKENTTTYNTTTTHLQKRGFVLASTNGINNNNNNNNERLKLFSVSSSLL